MIRLVSTDGRWRVTLKDDTLQVAMHTPYGWLWQGDVHTPKQVASIIPADAFATLKEN